jgi:WbqC-like protein family
MKLAIMQPYVFPYVGYFQLINAVDKFIIYDDVDFIKQGWINRNRILLNGESYLFTIPLADASSFRRIKDTGLNKKLYKDWVIKFYKTLDTVYHKAPYYEDVLSLLKKVFDKEGTDIGELATNSIKTTLSYLGIHTEIDSSSGVYSNQHLSGKERVIDICLKEKAGAYINAQGGADLYNKEYFQSYNINLQFLKPETVVYKQFENEFVPSLSIIDVMMFNSIQQIKVMLDKYRLE